MLIVKSPIIGPRPYAMLSAPLFAIVNLYPAVLMTFGSGSFPRATALGSRVSLRSPLPAAAGSGFFLQLQHQLVGKVLVAAAVHVGHKPRQIVQKRHIADVPAADDIFHKDGVVDAAQIFRPGEWGQELFAPSNPLLLIFLVFFANPLDFVFFLRASGKSKRASLSTRLGVSSRCV